MSRYIASRGNPKARLLVNEADEMLSQTIAELADAPVRSQHRLLPAHHQRHDGGRSRRWASEPVPEARPRSTPSHAVRQPLDALPGRETLDSGMATPLSVWKPSRPYVSSVGRTPTDPQLPHDRRQLHQSRCWHGANGNSANGYLNGPIDDVQLRPGHRAGGRLHVRLRRHRRRVQSNEVAVRSCASYSGANIPIFLSGNVNGRSIIHQLQEEGGDGLRYLHRALRPGHVELRSMRWALPPVRR